MTGPSYETPAEIRAFRVLGADLVGMSTVGEILVARQKGMECCAVSCVSNFALIEANCFERCKLMFVQETHFLLGDRKRCADGSYIPSAHRAQQPRLLC